MLSLRKDKGFTIVEILVAVGLVALLMVVAVPRLLDSRKTVSDSAAKQQIDTVRLSVNNWFAERDTFVGLTTAVLQARIPEVSIVAAGAATGKQVAGGRALTVGFLNSTPGSESVTLVASNGDTNCWGLTLAPAGVTHMLIENTLPAACSTSTVFLLTGSFEYPRLAG